MAFAPPGAVVVEFNTWNDTFVQKGCRTWGFSLANAAGHHYHIIDTPNFNHYNGGKLLPPASEVGRVLQASTADVRRLLAR